MVDKTNNCWIWIGSTRSINGYGQFLFNGKLVQSHRISFEIFKGDIPNGLVIDHLCRNKICVNPEHLEAVSNKENILRGIGVCANNKRKTQCKNGHEFTEQNIYRYPNGRKDCRICLKRRNDARPKKREVI